jgi:hypothetical protein
MRQNVRHQVGDEVVALEDNQDGDFKKGETFIVNSIKYCHMCGTQAVNIGLILTPNFTQSYQRCVCGQLVDAAKDGQATYASFRFAKIDEIPALIKQAEEVEDYETCAQLKEIIDNVLNEKSV